MGGSRCGVGWGERRPGAAPDLDPLDPSAPERLRQRRCGRPGRQDVVHDRYLPETCRPAANAERARDVRMALRRAFRLRLGRGVPPVDADPARRRESQPPADDSGQLFRVVESASEKPPSRDGHSDHHAGRRKAGAGRRLTREEPPEGGRRGELPAILHAMDEAAERWCEAPRSNHPVEGGRSFETCRARRGDGVLQAGGHRRVCGIHGERACTARADRAQQQRVQGAFAIGAGVVWGTDLAAEAARPWEEPVERVSSRALISRSLQHRPFARPRVGGSPRSRTRARHGPDPAPAAARRPPHPREGGILVPLPTCVERAMRRSADYRGLP